MKEVEDEEEAEEAEEEAVEEGNEEEAEATSTISRAYAIPPFLPFLYTRVGGFKLGLSSPGYLQQACSLQLGATPMHPEHCRNGFLPQLT